MITKTCPHGQCYRTAIEPLGVKFYMYCTYRYPGSSKVYSDTEFYVKELLKTMVISQISSADNSSSVFHSSRSNIPVQPIPLVRTPPLTLEPPPHTHTNSLVKIIIILLDLDLTSHM